MAHQSLYRRYRPRRFDEVRGQDHVTTALRNAVRESSEGHAYLFSGPRGTGKTSTARILAKALNCENLQNGEPCCDCTPCVDMEAGRSFDLFELDAASNNGVDAVRDLIERTAVGSPGRTKVYILDEVHMLSPGASNALLKTLEEPPEHVRFVLATTDPQKVLPTIRSRTQHFEFQLLSAAELQAQVQWIIADADLDVDDAAVAWVVQKGRGSSRDTLSALDQVVAAGGVVTRVEPVEQLYESLAAKDTGMAVLAVAEALAQGHDPRVLGAAFLDSLRDAFLVSLGVEVPHLMEHDREQYGRWAAALGTPTLTRAMEAVGSALVDMRQAADPRVPLEVALVRLTSTNTDSIAGLAERLERLEQSVASGVAPFRLRRRPRPRRRHRPRRRQRPTAPNPRHRLPQPVTGRPRPVPSWHVCVPAERAASRHPRLLGPRALGPRAPRRRRYLEYRQVPRPRQPTHQRRAQRQSRSPTLPRNRRRPHPSARFPLRPQRRIPPTMPTPSVRPTAVAPSRLLRHSGPSFPSCAHLQRQHVRTARS